MSKFNWDKTLSTIAAVAPTIATAFGGPLAGVAISMAAQALGIEPNEEAISNIVATGNPEVLLKLKQAEYDFKIKLEELEISIEDIAMKDRASARERESVVKDLTPSILGYSVTIGFFSVIGYILVNGLGVADPNMIGLIGILIGSISSKVEQVFSYYFGSSAGSRRKSEQITEIIKKPDK